MKLFVLYKHTTPSGKIYIGITCSETKKRWGSNGVNYKSSTYFYQAIKKYGWDNIKHEILVLDLTETEAKKLEIETIAKYKADNRKHGYNTHVGGSTGWYGKKLPEYVKQKMSLAQKGRKATEETKKKLREARKKQKSPVPKGSKFTEEHKNKIGQALKGRVFSEETKKKLSLSNIGKQAGIKNANYGKFGVLASHCEAVIRIEDNKRYECLSDASRENNTKVPHIIKCCKHQSQTTGGYHWKCADEEKQNKLNIKEQERKRLVAEKQANRIYQPIKQIPTAVKNLDTGEVFKSVSEASRSLDKKSTGHISDCCGGKRKTAYNYKWIYLK